MSNAVLIYSTVYSNKDVLTCMPELAYIPVLSICTGYYMKKCQIVFGRVASGHASVPVISFSVRNPLVPEVRMFIFIIKYGVVHN